MTVEDLTKTEQELLGKLVVLLRDLDFSFCSESGYATEFTLKKGTVAKIIDYGESSNYPVVELYKVHVGFSFLVDWRDIEIKK